MAHSFILNVGQAIVKPNAYHMLRGVILRLAKINQKELQFINLPQKSFALARISTVDQLFFNNQESIRAK